MAFPLRVIVLGNSGSGKSYLADALETLMASVGRPITCVHLDHVHFDTTQPRLPGVKLVRRSEAEKHALLDAAMQASPHGWVVEGIFGELAARCLDTPSVSNPSEVVVVWLSLDWDVCLQRLAHRPNNLGTTAAGTPESIAKLHQWAADYYTRSDQRSATGHAALVAAHTGPAVTLRSAESVDRWLAACEAAAGDVATVTRQWQDEKADF